MESLFKLPEVPNITKLEQQRGSTVIFRDLFRFTNDFEINEDTYKVGNFSNVLDFLVNHYYNETLHKGTLLEEIVQHSFVNTCRTQETDKTEYDLEYFKLPELLKIILTFCLQERPLNIDIQTLILEMIPILNDDRILGNHVNYFIKKKIIHGSINLLDLSIFFVILSSFINKNSWVNAGISSMKSYYDFSKYLFKVAEFPIESVFINQIISSLISPHNTEYPLESDKSIYNLIHKYNEMKAQKQKADIHNDEKTQEESRRHFQSKSVADNINTRLLQLQTIKELKKFVLESEHFDSYKDAHRRQSIDILTKKLNKQVNNNTRKQKGGNNFSTETLIDKFHKNSFQSKTVLEYMNEGIILPILFPLLTIRLSDKFFFQTIPVNNNTLYGMIDQKLSLKAVWSRLNDFPATISKMLRGNNTNNTNNNNTDNNNTDNNNNNNSLESENNSISSEVEYSIDSLLQILKNEFQQENRKLETTKEDDYEKLYHIEKYMNITNKISGSSNFLLNNLRCPSISIFSLFEKKLFPLAVIVWKILTKENRNILYRTIKSIFLFIVGKRDQDFPMRRNFIESLIKLMNEHVSAAEDINKLILSLRLLHRNKNIINETEFELNILQKEELETSLNKQVEEIVKKINLDHQKKKLKRLELNYQISMSMIEIDDQLENYSTNENNTWKLRIFDDIFLFLKNILFKAVEDKPVFSSLFSKNKTKLTIRQNTKAKEETRKLSALIRDIIICDIFNNKYLPIHSYYFYEALFRPEISEKQAMSTNVSKIVSQDEKKTDKRKVYNAEKILFGTSLTEYQKLLYNKEDIQPNDMFTPEDIINTIENSIQIYNEKHKNNKRRVFLMHRVISKTDTSGLKENNIDIAPMIEKYSNINIMELKKKEEIYKVSEMLRSLSLERFADIIKNMNNNNGQDKLKVKDTLQRFWIEEVASIVFPIINIRNQEGVETATYSLCVLDATTVPYTLFTINPSKEEIVLQPNVILQFFKNILCVPTYYNNYLVQRYMVTDDTKENIKTLIDYGDLIKNKNYFVENIRYGENIFVTIEKYLESPNQLSFQKSDIRKANEAEKLLIYTQKKKKQNPKI